MCLSGNFTQIQLREAWDLIRTTVQRKGDQALQQWPRRWVLVKEREMYNCIVSTVWAAVVTEQTLHQAFLKF